jgi:diphosphomevalonate decarboxylase
MDEVRRLRRDGALAFFTIDAGPHVKVLTTSASLEPVAHALEAVPGVTRVLRTRPGEGAFLVQGPP